MAYWALKKNGKVIDVLSDDDGKPTHDISAMLLSGTIDEVAKLASFDEAKRILQGLESQNSGNKLDNLVRNVVNQAEGFINDLCDSIEGVRKEAVKGVKGGKSDINDIAARAKSAGQTMLKELRSIHEKALDKAKAKKKK